MQNPLHESEPRVAARALACLFTALLVLVLSVHPAHAQTYTVLHSFSVLEGIGPQAALIMDSSGNLYGTTNFGGYTGNSICEGNNGCGTIFKLDTAGQLTTLYSFQGTSDGYEPYESVMRIGTSLFGATTYGGTGTCAGTVACGTVYQLTSAGVLKVLHTFEGPDGSTPPPGRLNTDGLGNAYGAAAYGGASGQGVIFKINSKGVESTVYNFGNQPDGNGPMGGLVIANKGQDIYGMTEYGGNCPYSSLDGFGCGTVYKLTPAGVETQLYVFTGSTDGAYPTEDLAADSSGNLYGTTTSGGDVNCGSTAPQTPAHDTGATNPWAAIPNNEQAPPGCGVVFKVNATTGAETVLYAFTNGSDGGFPLAGAVLDSAGDVYGTTSEGGNTNCKPPLGCGTVFKITPSGQFSVIHTFGGIDGASPGWGSMLIDKSGTLYGTTGAGGSSNNGVIFKLTP